MRWLAPILVLVLSGIACVQEPPASSDTAQWREPVELARGEAHVGPWRMNDSDFRYVDDPTVALTPGGDVGVAWADQARKDIYFRRYNADGEVLQDSPVNISGSPDVFSWLPRMVFTDNDTIHVLWQEIIFSGGSHGGEILYAHSADGGSNFSEPVNLSNTIHGAGKGRLDRRYWHNGSLDLAAGPDGALYAAWTEYEGPLRVSRSIDGGDTWSQPVTVAGEDGQLPARGPTLATGPENHVHLAWAVGEDASADIHYALSRDGGRRFSKAQVIAPGSAHADAPKLARAGNGTLHLAWMESTEGPLRAYRVMYARRQPNEERFEEPKVISDPLPEGFADARFPHLALDGQGNSHVLFGLFRPGARRGQGMAVVQSSNAGDTFGAPALLPRAGNPQGMVNGSLQGLLMDKFAVTPEGRMFVVNSTLREDESSHVWLLRSR